MRKMTVIVLTGSECNINCRYCYVEASRRNIKQFPIDKLSVLIRNCTVGFDEVEFCWHGGEPLLVGKDFYRAALAGQYEASCGQTVKFRNNLQSNGTLLDEEWLQFLKEHDIGLGISFDAPPETNTLQRGCTQTLLKVLALARREHFPLGAICVISKHNVGKARDIFDFFSTEGVSSYRFLPLKPVPMPCLPDPPDDAELADLYCRTFDLWLSQDNLFSKIEPLRSMVLGLLGKYPPSCSFSAACPNNMVAIDQEGRVVPCSSLVDDSFVMGNILAEPLATILRRTANGIHATRRRAVEQHCMPCKFLALCQGGCRADAYWATGRHDGAYPYCEARKRTFSYLERKLQDLNVLL